MLRGNLSDLLPPPSSDSGRRSEANPGIILGVEMANHLNVHQGEWVTVISPVGRLTPMGQVPRSKLFQVVGILHSGMYEYDNQLAYVNLPAAQQFLGMGDSVTGVEVKIANIYSAAAIAKSLRQRLGYSCWVRDWMHESQSLFGAETR